MSYYSPGDFLSWGSDRAEQALSPFVTFGELSSCVSVGTPSEEERGNHPLVKPLRKASWPDSVDVIWFPAVPVSHPDDSSSDITMLWLLHT